MFGTRRVESHAYPLTHWFPLLAYSLLTSLKREGVSYIVHELSKMDEYHANDEKKKRTEALADLIESI